MASGRRRGDDPLVYASGKGRVCPACRRPAAECVCRSAPRAPRGDGVVRVRRETQGRSGKTVTAIHGLPLASDALAELAGELKRRCGSGGSAKDGVIEIQGDHVERVVADLSARGYTVKRAGG
jgi:translation initiation factor 1